MQTLDRPYLLPTPPRRPQGLGKLVGLRNSSRLTHARLRRPTPLPSLLATTLLGRWVSQVRSLFCD